MHFVRRTDQYTKLELASGGGDGDIVRWNQTPAPAQGREELRPLRCHRLIEVDDPHHAYERIYLRAPGRSAFGRARERDADQEFCVDDRRKGYGFIGDSRQ